MLYRGYELSPDSVLESCIWFYDDSMEVRVYYNENAADWCKESFYQADLLRVLNFINARVWARTADGIGGSLYKPSYLYTPRIYMTEDGCYDITLTTAINYDFYEVAPLETADYMTAGCPELLDRLSPAIFGVLLGNYTLGQAISHIKNYVLQENSEVVN